MNSAGIPGSAPDEREAPDWADLARRVAVLETRFDTVLPTLATKADLAELCTEIEALRADLIKWMAATLMTILLSFVGLFVGLTRTISAMPNVPHSASVSVAESVPPALAARAQSQILVEAVARP